MRDVVYIEMNMSNVIKKFHKNDHHKFYDGVYLTAEELNDCIGVLASCDIKVNDNITSDYVVVYDDGTRQSCCWEDSIES